VQPSFAQEHPRLAGRDAPPRRGQRLADAGSSAILVGQLGQQLGLVFGGEGGGDLVELALHHRVELVEGEVDAVVGEPALGKL
jgi:uncharacterized membrane protein